VEAYFMMVLKAAAAALLIVGAASLSAQQPARPLTLSRDEQGAITALQAAAAGPDRLAQDNALAAARAAARGADARYAIAHYQLEIGRARGDAAMQTQAVDAIVDSGLATPDEMPSLLSSQLSRAYSAGDMARTERLLARIIEIQPNNVEALADYAQFKSRVRSPVTAAADRAMSVSLFQRALAANEAMGRLSPESLHRRALAVAYDATQRINGAPPLAPQAAPLAIAFGQKLVAAYPTASNWRDALLDYRELAPVDPALALDIRRLMRAADALGGERDYLEFANLLGTAGLPGEAKAVLDDGVTRGVLDTGKPAIAAAIAGVARRATADRAALPGLRSRAAAGTGAQARAAGDASFAFGQYTEAATLYLAALQKGGEDPNLVNTRLGAALALAGRRAEAEAALRGVTGPRADLAGFWLVWLAHRPAGT
jgi:tetratricopeptide (TPR) repeat protein